VVLDQTSRKLFFLDRDGNVLRELPLQIDSDWISDFAFVNGDEIVVAYQARGCQGDASISHYGVGWPGTNGTPKWNASDLPAMCSVLRIGLTNSRGAPTLATVFMGLASDYLPTAWDGILLVTPMLARPMALPADGLTIEAMIPCQESLCGLELNLQALESDPGASKGVSFTDAVKLVIGG
jgi:hypothetical protein